MFKKGNKFYSIITGSCPRCHQESMYKGKNPYNPSTTISLNNHCSHCKLKYNIEPSFFYGAMYVSYGLGVMVGITAFLICYFIFKTNLKIAFISIVVSLIVLMPYIMRISRNIWINLNVKFDDKY